MQQLSEIHHPILEARLRYGRAMSSRTRWGGMAGAAVLIIGALVWSRDGTSVSSPSAATRDGGRAAGTVGTDMTDDVETPRRGADASTRNVVREAEPMPDTSNETFKAMMDERLAVLRRELTQAEGTQDQGAAAELAARIERIEARAGEAQRAIAAAERTRVEAR